MFIPLESKLFLINFLILIAKNAKSLGAFNVPESLIYTLIPSIAAIQLLVCCLHYSKVILQNHSVSTDCPVLLVK